MLKKARQKFPPSLQRMRGGPKARQKIPSRIPYAFKLFRWPMLKKKWLHAVEEGKKKKRKRQTLSPHTTPHGTPTSRKRRNNFFSTAPGAASPRRPFLLTLPHAAAPIFPTELPHAAAPNFPHAARLVGLPYAVRNPICALHHAAPLRPPLCYSTPPWLPCGSSTPSAALETDRTPRLLGTPLGSSTVSIQVCSCLPL